jgi:hypothetical protein
MLKSIHRTTRFAIQIFKNKSETDKLGSLDKFNCTEGIKSRIFNVHVALQTEIRINEWKFYKLDKKILIKLTKDQALFVP